MTDRNLRDYRGAHDALIVSLKRRANIEARRRSIVDRPAVRAWLLVLALIVAFGSAAWILLR